MAIGVFGVEHFRIRETVRELAEMGVKILDVRLEHLPPLENSEPKIPDLDEQTPDGPRIK